MYDFAAQLAREQAANRELDAFFAGWFDIEPASDIAQRRGIDRFFTRRSNGVCEAVEYKADWTASRTGNAFVETVSVDTAGKDGWAYTSRAVWLLYFLPDDGLCYCLRLEALRRELPRWEREYPTRRVPNRGYHTVGLLVPLREFEALSEQALVVPAQEAA